MFLRTTNTYGCKSRRKLITTSEAQAQLLEGDREWERQAWSINCEPMDKNLI